MCAGNYRIAARRLFLPSSPRAMGGTLLQSLYHTYIATIVTLEMGWEWAGDHLPRSRPTSRALISNVREGGRKKEKKRGVNAHDQLYGGGKKVHSGNPTEKRLRVTTYDGREREN